MVNNKFRRVTGYLQPVRALRVTSCSYIYGHSAPDAGFPFWRENVLTGCERGSTFNWFSEAKSSGDAGSQTPRGYNTRRRGNRFPVLSPVETPRVQHCNLDSPRHHCAARRQNGIQMQTSGEQCSACSSGESWTEPSQNIAPRSGYHKRLPRPRAPACRFDSMLSKEADARACLIRCRTCRRRWTVCQPPRFFTEVSALERQ